MTPTIKSEWFAQTCDKLYDRHYYTIGNKKFDDFELVQSYWWNVNITNQVVHVHDFRNKKGFG